LKIAFLSPSLSRTAGGIFEIERHLGRALAELPGVTVEVYGAEDEHTAADLPLWEPLVPKAYPFIGPPNFRYSRELRKAFLSCDADVVHLHALWMHTSMILLNWSKRWRRPYITTANGMLGPWALKNANLKKQVVARLYERRCLERAACIQVNSEQEFREVRQFGLRNPVCIVPNGVEIDSGPAAGAPFWDAEIHRGAKVLLYLGRLHPKKNLPALLRAWLSISRQAQAKEWYLVIAGWDELNHRLELINLIRDLDLPRVVVGGPQYGEAKQAAFHGADAFVLPSLSEGLPMAALEAWAAAKPVVMTAECNLPEGFAAGAALRIGSDKEGIIAGVSDLFAMSTADRRSMGDEGFALVRKRFTWPIVARQVQEVYQWVIKGGPSPGCLVTE
jgi:poly(glycerol-phosphate) alpha-glucosyltransferase